MKRNKIILILLVILGSVQSGFSQFVHPLVGCTISGNSPVYVGNTWTYTLAGCSASSWTITCGSITSFTSTSVTVYFNLTGCSSAVLTAKNGSSTLASKTISVSQPPLLGSGSITSSPQTINYNTAPANITASSASGGSCSSYSYDWQSSPDNSTWSEASGSNTGQNYQPPALTTNTYFKRRVICGSQVAYTSSVLITVYPQLLGGTITPQPININYNTSPGTLTVSGITGGNGIYTYRWLNSSAPNNFGAISGATGTSYTPPILTATTYYEVEITSNGVIISSTIASVGVYPNLGAGSITPFLSYANYNGSPGTLSVTGVVGGSGTYSYQWQSSTDDIFSNPVNITGAVGPTYTPINLTSTTYYRVAVSSNGSTPIYCTYCIVGIYPPIQGGAISPALSQMNYNTMTVPYFSLTGVTGGSGTYTYQWEISYDNTIWADWEPYKTTMVDLNPMTETTYLRVAVTSNGLTAYSAVATIIINPQLIPGTISLSDISIASGTSPGIITVSSASGGGCGGNFVYQWQSSTDGINFTDVTGVTGVNYTPGNITTITYFRRKVACGTDIEFSNVCRIWIATASVANYVRVREFNKPGITDTASARGLTDPNDVKQTTQYFDGLGRTVETISKQASPQGKDMVSFDTYDIYGRESMKYLPYVSTTTDGNYKIGPISEQTSFNSGQFPNEQYYYGLTNFEASPNDRQLASYPAGISWVGATRGVQEQYLFNSISDSVRIWEVADANASIPTTGAMYSAGTLSKNITWDEQNHQVVEFKDKLGKIILKKVQLANTTGTAHMGWLNTYYIYDDFENLRFVLQPRAIELLLASGNWNISTSIRDELSFYYSYDDRKRMTIKKIPGAWETWMVYDARDRVVMTQDSNLRASGKWLVTKYDNENRPDSTGLLTDIHDRTYHQSLAYAVVDYPNTSSGFELMTRTYYDNYSWTGGVGLISSANTLYTSNGSYVITNYNTSPVYAQQIVQYPCTRGLTTGSQSKVIGTGSQFLANISFYDDHGRVIEMQSLNYTNGKDTLVNQYDFNGKVVRNLVRHQNAFSASQCHSVLTKMAYDAEGRLLTIDKNVDNAATDQRISTSSYNELGQLKNKQLGNSLDNMAYEYNIRGWLATINKDFVSGAANNNYFGMELGYDKSASVNSTTSYANPVFNGNIAGTIWKSAGDGVARKYDFTYDNVNRFVKADFNQNSTGSAWDHNTINYSVYGFDESNGYQMTYDANGNILTMIQQGFKVGGSNIVDALAYTYQPSSNKLQQVWDYLNDPTSKLGDFHYKNETKQAIDYAYDGNGNLMMDNNKSISGIIYNYLNLPQRISITGKGYITYDYDASGAKLCKTTVDSTITPVKITRTTYMDGFVYQATSPAAGGPVAADTLQFIGHEEGRTRWAFHKYLNGTSAYGFEYDFFEKDHLGNTRVLLTQQKDTASYLASGETNYRSTESQLFSNLTTTCVPRTSAPGYPNNVTVTNPNDSVFKVSGEPGSHKTGPSLLLKVMSGDKIDLAVQYFYNSGTVTTPNTSINDVLASLATGVVNMASGGKGAMTDLNNTTNSPIFAALNSFQSNELTSPDKPKAYLNWILLDEQLNYVSSYPQSGALPVLNSGLSGTNLQPPLAYSGIPITKNGYLYVWVSNETPNWNVYFDNMVVKHYTGPELEETHYYPFGLAMTGISSKALKPRYIENKQRFNEGSELASGEFLDGTGLEEYESNFRMLDPQIGRFWQLDPISEIFQSWSSYSFSFDNPILFNDPLGLAPEVVPGAPPFFYSNVELAKTANSDYHPDPSKSAPELPSATQVPGAGKTTTGTTQSSGGNQSSGNSNTTNTNSQVIRINTAGGNNTHTTWDRATDSRIRQLDHRVQGPASNFVNRVHDELNINLRVIQGVRTIQEQNNLFAQGRTRPGNIVTRARGGQSYHNFGLAIDVVIINPDGTLDWSPVPPQVVQIARDEGFEWGGDWNSFPDRPHFQMTFGQTLTQLRNRFGIRLNQ